MTKFLLKILEMEKHDSYFYKNKEEGLKVWNLVLNEFDSLKFSLLKFKFIWFGEEVWSKLFWKLFLSTLGLLKLFYKLLQYSAGISSKNILFWTSSAAHFEQKNTNPSLLYWSSWSFSLNLFKFFTIVLYLAYFFRKKYVPFCFNDLRRLIIKYYLWLVVNFDYIMLWG